MPTLTELILLKSTANKQQVTKQAKKSNRASHFPVINVQDAASPSLTFWTYNYIHSCTDQVSLTPHHNYFHTTFRTRHNSIFDTPSIWPGFRTSLKRKQDSLKFACICESVCACVCVCIYMCVCVHVVSVEFWQYACKERVSAWGLCGLGALSIHYYYYLYYCHSVTV